MFCLPSSDADSLLSPLSPRRKRHQVHGQRRHTTGETYVSAVLCKTCMSPPSSLQQLRHLCDQTVINHRKPETASSVSPRHSPNSLSLSLSFNLFFLLLASCLNSFSISRLRKGTTLAQTACGRWSLLHRVHAESQTADQVKTAATWDQGERRTCKTRWKREKEERGRKETCVAVWIFFSLSPFFSFSLQRQESVKNELPAIAALQFAVCSALELAQNLLYPAKLCSSDYHREPVCVCVCLCRLCMFKFSSQSADASRFLHVIYLSCATLCLSRDKWANKHNGPLTVCVFTASGVDTVGEVVMCVDILPQPNGEHKINVKGEKAEQAVPFFSDIAQLLLRTSCLFLL